MNSSSDGPSLCQELNSLMRHPGHFYFALAGIALVGLLTVHAEPGSDHVSEDAFWADAAALLPGFTGSATPAGASDRDGSWSGVIAWPHIPVSAAGLPNGKLLTFAGQERTVWPGTTTQTYWTIYDPVTGRFDENLYLDHEMFCAHLVMRADGRVQTSGGRHTIEHSSVFDFRSNTWNRVDDMEDRRWYATSVALPDGDVFVVAGSGGSNTAERYSVAKQHWAKLNGINWQPVSGSEGFESEWWPYLFVAPSGKLFHFGPTNAMHWVDPEGNGSRTSAGLSVPNNHYPKHAGVTMYASGKILVAGGAATTGGGSTNICYTVDLNSSPPMVRQVASMRHPRRFSNAVVLPTGEVLIAGGNTSGHKFSDLGSILTAEIWNPVTNKWRQVADMAVPRNYHSVGLLLADGRVFLAGGGYFSTVVDHPASHQDAQIYTPPSLYDDSGALAPRPVLSRAPDNVTCGSVFEVEATANLTKFAAIRLQATTHGLSTDPRYLDLPFSERGEGNYRLVAHPNPNVMVPGYWMLFGIDATGVYSESKIIHINTTGNGAASGLRGTYFNGTGLSDKRFERIDHKIDFQYGNGSPDADQLGNDTFSIRWEGWVVPEFTGTYTFHTQSDDGVRLLVDGQALIDHWQAHPSTEDSGAIDLIAGVPVTLEMEYFEETGDAGIQLLWSGPGIAKEIIPEKNLRHANPAGSAMVTAHGVFELYIDGELVSIGTEEDRVYHANFPAGSGTTIALRVAATGAGGGIAGHFVINDEPVEIDEEWKVATQATHGWNRPGFDDGTWARAVDTGGIHGEIRGLPVAASVRRLWAAEADAGEIFLRRYVGSPQLIEPEPRTNFVGDSVHLALPARGGHGTLTWTAEDLPDGLTLDSRTGIISGSPSEGSTGNHAVRLVAEDSKGTAEVTFRWRILGRKIVMESFDSGAGNFHYLGDPFRDTNEPGYATGTHVSSSGNASDGALQVVTGGRDNRNISHMSGGWQMSFELHSPTMAQLGLHYQLAQSDTFEPDEVSQALLSVNGKLYGLGGKDYLAQLQGGDALSTGWQAVDLALGEMRAGTHTVIIGAYTSRKTDASKKATLLIDDVWITTASLPNEAPRLGPLPPRENTVGAAVAFQIEALDPDNDRLMYSAEGLPDALHLDTETGHISGRLSQAGSFDVGITVSDGTVAVSESFRWTVNPAITLPKIQSAPSAWNEPIVFTASPMGGTNARYRWNFGDGTGDTAWSSSSMVTHRYEGPGRYPVTFTASDDTREEISTSFIQNVAPTLLSDLPNVSQSLLYEEREGNDRLWNVNPDNGTISIVDIVTHGKIAELAVGRGPRSLALHPGGTVWVVSKQAASISRIRTADLGTLEPITLPPGSEPHGLVFDPQGRHAYVTLEGTGEVVQFDGTTGSESARVGTGPHPRHLSITGDGSTILVSRFISPPVAGEATAQPDLTQSGGEVLVLGASPLAVTGVIELQSSDEPDSGGGGRGLPNYLGPAAISPAGDMAWLPSKQDNLERGQLRDGRHLTYENTVRAISSRINLLGGAEDYSARIDHDDTAMPSTALFGPNGLYVFVALEGSREVAIIDAYGQQELFRIDVGRAPQGLAVSPEGKTLYVHNFMSRTVSSHDVSGLIEQGSNVVLPGPVYDVVGDEALPAPVLLGKQLFYDSRDDRLSRENYISCAACHSDGGHDGRVWDMTGFGEGLRNTIDLRGRGGLAHGPLHWSGNFDEVQDFEHQIRALAAGDGLLVSGNPHPPLAAGNAGRSEDLDALAAYVSSLADVSHSPFRKADGSLTPEAVLGREVFRKQNCAQCHSGPNFTDSGIDQGHDIGTIRSTSGGRLGGALTGIDTPTLRGLWNGAPYLHNGSAATISDAILAHDQVTLDGRELEQLTAYLRQIDANEREAPDYRRPTLTNSGEQTNDQYDFVHLPLSAGEPNMDAMLFTAENLPPGLSVEPATGVISGFISAPGTFATMVTVEDPAGGKDFTGFTWIVRPAVPRDQLGRVDLPVAVFSPDIVFLEVPYTVSEVRELAVWLRDVETGGEVLGHAITTVQSGAGRHHFRVPIRAGAREGHGYIWELRLLPLAWTSPAEAIEAIEDQATITRRLGEGVMEDSLISVVAPEAVAPADTASITVIHEAAARRKLGIWLHDNAEGGGIVARTMTTIGPGPGTEHLNVGIAGEALPGEGYRWIVRLLPEDWTHPDDALDTYEQGVHVENHGPSLVNFASLPQASARQSSNFTSRFASGPDLARDGDTGGDWRRGSVAFTGLDEHAWWEVDLGEVREISHLLVWNRTDCCGERLAPYSVFVSDSPLAASSPEQTRGRVDVKAQAFTDPPSAVQRIPVNGSGRYVRIQLEGSGYLSLAEVQVYGVDANSASGVVYHYYEGVWRQMPDFDALAMKATATASTFDLGVRRRDDFFALRFRANLAVPTAGLYKFFTTSTGAGRVLIDDIVVVDNDRRQSGLVVAGSIALSAGLHPIEVRYFAREEKEDDLALGWEGPGIAREPIPSSALILNQRPSFPDRLLNGRLATDDNAGDDLLELTAKYALGIDPDKGLMAGTLHLAASSDGQRVDVWYKRPARLYEVGYTLEVSEDYRTWVTAGVHEISPIEGGWERVEYRGVNQMLSGTGERGFVRLRIKHHPWGKETSTPPLGWSRTVLREGYQTHGLSLNARSVFAGIVEEAGEGRIVATAGGFLPALRPGRASYLELISGEYEGHRMDVDPARSSDQVVALDGASSLNTLRALPGEGLVGARFVVREHWTLSVAYPIELFQSGREPAGADEILFLSGLRYDNYFALQSDARHYWTSATQAALDPASGLVIPPGAGCFVHRRRGAPDLALMITGEVRTTAFAQPLHEGYQLLASPYPFDFSPSLRGLTWDRGFEGSVIAESADQLQFWRGDAGQGLTGYNVYFLLDGGRSEWRYWTSFDDSGLRNENDRPLFRGDRAFFFRGITERPFYRIPGF